jgi:catechol 2,3-dioxygenase-like lactoylglutathione lyase family enzyme
VNVTRVLHAGIVVKDLSKALAFYAETFGCRDYRFAKFKKSGYELDLAFVPIGDLQLELVQPIEGPWVRRMQRKGEGFTELCLEVKNLADFYDKMKSRGVTLVDQDELPLTDKKFEQSVDGNMRFAYLPTRTAFGSWIEVMEPYSLEKIGKACRVESK